MTDGGGGTPETADTDEVPVVAADRHPSPHNGENKALKATTHPDPVAALFALGDLCTEDADRLFDDLNDLVDDGAYDDYTKGRLDAFRTIGGFAYMAANNAMQRRAVVPDDRED